MESIVNRDPLFAKIVESLGDVDGQKFELCA